MDRTIELKFRAPKIDSVLALTGGKGEIFLSKVDCDKKLGG